MQYNVGLDFGTNQTKICTLINPGAQGIHEFFKFPNGSFFLPSRVAYYQDGTFSYGDETCQEKKLKSEYFYFKMAAAEDDAFINVTAAAGQNGNGEFMGFHYNQFGTFRTPHTPAFLSAIYIAYVMLLVKEKYKPKLPTSTSKPQSFIGRLFGAKAAESNESSISIEEPKYTFQLGIPTEWSYVANYERKRKFESILLAAHTLTSYYETLDDYLQASESDLKGWVAYATKEYSKYDKSGLLKKLNEFGLSVFPESGAGLYFLLKSGSLENQEYYSTMDIGAGTTDVSFFKVDGNSIRYFASESFQLASNNIIQRYSKADSLHKIKSAEKGLIDSIPPPYLNNNELPDKIENALRSTFHDFQKLMKRLYGKRILKTKIPLSDWNGRPLLMYGGGSLFPYFNGNSDLELFHGGGPFASAYYLSMVDISQYIPRGTVSSNNEGWESRFPVLAVAYGLSFIKDEQAANWLDLEHYYAMDDVALAELIPHPFNEDKYIYDILS